MHPVIEAVTERISQRSARSRAAYLRLIERAADDGPSRARLDCSNLAHGFAACGAEAKQHLSGVSRANIAIVSAYNDMLSAHQPFESYPALIKQTAAEAGCTAQFAGGVPAMCDGVTQGQPGMELSLFSRDQIALSTAIALSHNMFDAALYLGVCDKIVPGLVIGALRFGHLPALFVPAGPMPSGLPNREKARIREEYAQGKVTRKELLEAEAGSYHSPGTCTFYGTANTNQMLMEFMGLQLPGTSFVNPGTPLREALTRQATRRVIELTRLHGDYLPIGKIVDVKAVVNGMVGLLATGGSTNLTIHLITMAGAAGIRIGWDDFAALSRAVPLLARVYPNGHADVNQFQAAGGLGYLIGELLAAGLLHDEVRTVSGAGLHRYTEEPFLGETGLAWRAGTPVSLDEEIVRPSERPFSSEGGLQVLAGNLGAGICKTSALKNVPLVIEAPAVIFSSQEALEAAWKAGELNRDCVVVVRFQGPAANGMPELHRMTPFLGVLQDQGYRVALVTDGRMSGASGKVLAAIHLSPEASRGGPLAKLRDGDLIRLDAEQGELNVLLDDEQWRSRPCAVMDLADKQTGLGRELFAFMRAGVSSASEGATLFRFEQEASAS